MCVLLVRGTGIYMILHVIHPQVTLKHIATSCRVETKEK